MSVKKVINIEVSGEYDGEIELALEEVFRLLKKGYLSGKNSNETGGFYFEVVQTEEHARETM